VFFFLLFLVIARREIPEAIGAPVLPMGIAREMLRYGWWQYLSTLLLQVNMRFNVFLLAALGDLYQTGLYTAVLGPASVLSMLSSPLVLVLLPRTARRFEDSAFPYRVAGALRLIVILTFCRRSHSRFSHPCFFPGPSGSGSLLPSNRSGFSFPVSSGSLWYA
jgi:O-antigen/teichoic acid export membrane protein